MRIPIGVVLLLVSAGLAAQGPLRPTDEDVRRAEQFLPEQATPLVYRGDVRPIWMVGDRFYYRNTLADGEQETVVVDPVKPGRVVCPGVVTTCEGQVIVGSRAGVVPPAPSAPALGAVTWWVLGKTAEAVRFASDDTSAHLALVDLRSGQVKRQLTVGPWRVTKLAHVDESGRTVYFMAVGREAKRDPYYRHLYRVSLADAKVELLTPEDGDHTIEWSPSRRYFIDTWSTPTKPPVSVVRAAGGGRVVNLQQADTSALSAIGWTPPVSFLVKASDGHTELPVLMHLPSRMEAGRLYPAVVHADPEFQLVGDARSFHAARGDTRALAELGFAVVQIGGRPSSWLVDQVTAFRQIAEMTPFIDRTRVGIYGDPQLTTAALAQHPDIFTVGVPVSSGDADLQAMRRRWAHFVEHLMRPPSSGGYTILRGR